MLDEHCVPDNRQDLRRHLVNEYRVVKRRCP